MNATRDGWHFVYCSPFHLNFPTMVTLMHSKKCTANKLKYKIPRLIPTIAITAIQ
jgi:hypothetical protein